MTLPKIVLASHNAHKLSELRAMLGIPDALLVSAGDYANAPDVDENGDTFEANALIKARALRDFTGEWAIADDSGLAVDALDGAPGIYSARYAGVHGDDAGNNAKLLADLVPFSEPWRARYVCAVALVSPDGQEHVVTGLCHGTLITESRGTNGFGYDPIFIPDGYDQTFGELTYAQKCTFSHRAAAVAKLKPILSQLFENY